MSFPRGGSGEEICLKSKEMTRGEHSSNILPLTPPHCDLFEILTISTSLPQTYQAQQYH